MIRKCLKPNDRKISAPKEKIGYAEAFLVIFPASTEYVERNIRQPCKNDSFRAFVYEFLDYPLGIGKNC